MFMIVATVLPIPADAGEPLTTNVTLDATCSDGARSFAFSLTFETDKARYAQQMRSVRRKLAETRCHLTNASRNRMEAAEKWSQSHLNGDIYVAHKIVLEAQAKPWAEVHMAAECLAMLGGERFEHAQVYGRSIANITAYSARLRALSLEIDHVRLVAKEMDLIHGILATCAAFG
ncbi:MAG: hypothetical protein SFW09_04510, partial [Hyphomicrobiaceae bacterium]|nr:hypothetical protein [Hyphomicrobiaceae bacterium]